MDKPAQRFRGLRCGPGLASMQLHSAVCSPQPAVSLSLSLSSLACFVPPSCQPACLPCPCSPFIVDWPRPFWFCPPARPTTQSSSLPVLPILFLPVSSHQSLCFLLPTHHPPYLSASTQPSFLRSTVPLPPLPSYLYLTFPIALSFPPFALSTHAHPTTISPILFLSSQPYTTTVISQPSQVESSESSPLSSANHECGQSASIQTNPIRSASKHSTHCTARPRSTLSISTSGSLVTGNPLDSVTSTYIAVRASTSDCQDLDDPTRL